MFDDILKDYNKDRKDFIISIYDSNTKAYIERYNKSYTIAFYTRFNQRYYSILENQIGDYLLIPEYALKTLDDLSTALSCFSKNKEFFYLEQLEKDIKQEIYIYIKEAISIPNHLEGLTSIEKEEFPIYMNGYVPDKDSFFTNKRVTIIGEETYNNSPVYSKIYPITCGCGNGEADNMIYLKLSVIECIEKYVMIRQWNDIDNTWMHIGDDLKAIVKSIAEEKIFNSRDKYKYIEY